VKVVSENGTVFLMGLLTHAEADAAAQTASTTSGAERVVKLFEYLD
jgi:osmotically-inducible protein OsmY